MLKKLFKPKFVKYDPKYITLSDEDNKVIDIITEDIRLYVKKSKELNNINHHTRAVHAKSYCGLKAKFEILDNIPKEYAQGLYAKAGIHDAVIRFSNAAAAISPDRRLGLGQGLAIKIFDVPGKKLAPGEEDSTTFDYALVNGPIFFTNSIEDYAYLSKLNFGVNGYLGDGLLGKGKFVFHWLTKYAKSSLMPKDCEPLTPLENSPLFLLRTLGYTIISRKAHFVMATIWPKSESLQPQLLQKRLSVTRFICLLKMKRFVLLSLKRSESTTISSKYKYSSAKISKNSPLNSSLKNGKSLMHRSLP
ncbi:hypothetical protein [uncultured Psychrobacter sp.]|jgi:hypothetical protein|uniref:hypothetical protein n=1 Tax=uncultured Psychrobacter sp. TaxID=259303 RepID=UPI00262435AA|nr:hypothetical protein [uncultured Psychrobacter sp.]